MGAEPAAGSSPGTLYVVATPIGNLEDLSPRAARILAEVDGIVAEDTRRTGKLLQHLGVRGAMTSYPDGAEARKAPGLVARLAGGESLALVSDAGTPLVSDPGYRLVRGAIDAGVEVVPVPGPNAVTTLLCASGLPIDRFVFEGFLPPKGGARKRRIDAIRDETRTVVLYESPYRIARTLRELAAALGPRPAVVGRELTKAFEEIQRGDLESLASSWAERKPKGEFTIAIGPPPR